MYYTVGIKRSFLPGYRKFKVVNNWIEVQVDGFQIEPRMVLELKNGTELSIPGINKKAVKVYADYKDFKDHRAKSIDGLFEPSVNGTHFDQKQLVEQYRAELASRQPQYAQG